MHVMADLPTPPDSFKVNTPSEGNASTTLDKLWWNTNLPEEQWTKSCPDYLEGQAEKNINIMSVRDEDHPRMSWGEAKDLILSGRTGQFHRMPTDLRRYIKYCHQLKQRYGSVLYFIQHERLGWPTIDPSGDVPFTNGSDYKVLYNDWPYSLDRDITHVVVWTKFELQEDPTTGRLTNETRGMLEDFVVETFCRDPLGRSVMDRSDIGWFKNWMSLRSVHALEHFHVMLYRAPPELLDRVTNKDRPMCEQFQDV